jgi:hypothetical protein
MPRTYKTRGRCGCRLGSMTSADEPVRFNSKIAVLLRDDLQVWQQLNVTSFLVSGIAAAIPEIIGEPYEDASGTKYLSVFRQPVLVFEGSKEVLQSVHSKALNRHLPLAIFTSDLFSTNNDQDNRAAVAAVETAALDLVGLSLHGPKNAVDKVLKGARMHY